MADYSYMNTPKVKTQNKQNQGGQQPTGRTQPLTPVTNTNNQNRRATSTQSGGDVPFHALGSPTPSAQNLNSSNYNPNPGAAQLPPAQDTSNPYANIQQPGGNPASGFGNPTSTYNGGTNGPLTTGGGNNASQWSLPEWNPTTQATPQFTQGTQAAPGGGSQNYWDSANPWRINPKDQTAMNYMTQALDVAQFDQNNYIYANDFNEAQRRYDLDYQRGLDQDNWQKTLTQRQQQAAELQAQLAYGLSRDQFGHTQQMDLAGLGLSQQQINNQFTQGMDQNQASRDVANTYGNAQMYGADQQLAGNRYQADQQLAGQLGSAGMYSDAQRYQAMLGLQGQQYQADRGLDVANVYGNAQNYGADQQLAGQLGSAGMYSDAQRYQALLAMQGQLGSAGIYSNAQMYGTDAQERMNAALMANNLAVANMQAYGRSQPVQANWARNWG